MFIGFIGGGEDRRGARVLGAAMASGLVFVMVVEAFIPGNLVKPGAAVVEVVVGAGKRGFQSSEGPEVMGGKEVTGAGLGLEMRSAKLGSWNSEGEGEEEGEGEGEGEEEGKGEGSCGWGWGGVVGREVGEREERVGVEGSEGHRERVREGIGALSSLCGVRGRGWDWECCKLRRSCWNWWEWDNCWWGGGEDMEEEVDEEECKERQEELPQDEEREGGEEEEKEEEEEEEEVGDDDEDPPPIT